jgi:hypothetical protein
MNYKKINPSTAVFSIAEQRKDEQTLFASMLSYNKTDIERHIELAKEYFSD